MREKYYRKVGKKYVEAGVDFGGFPSNGVWIVYDGGWNKISKLGEIKKPFTHARIAIHIDDMTKAISKLFEEVKKQTHRKIKGGGETWQVPCNYDIAAACVKAVYEKEQQLLEKNNQNVIDKLEKLHAVEDHKS